MKKILLVGLLVCAILTSVIGGTMAAYTKTVEIATDATVTAKSFYFDAAGTSANWSTPVEIAPGENVTFQFTVYNYEEESVAEVAIAVEDTVTLTGELKDALGDQLSMTVTPSGSETLAGGAMNSVVYSVVVTWTAGANDNSANGKSAAIHVSVTGTQA